MKIDWKDDKNVKAMKRITKSVEKLDYSMENIGEVAKTGLEMLREANDMAVARLREAQAEAKLAVTDEKVYDFMDKTMMDYASARKTLEAAYVDDVCPYVKDPDDA